ncbi:hypothetical protein V6N13_017585 [Hibiscus sabdariffa]|uniref:RNase H type-1 domain-containing protein n=2 Tax=Hibiscus sabdariffa TaxID=183260 RepID=A0ABR2AIC9_9ROSI
MPGDLNDIIIRGNMLVKDCRRVFGVPVDPCRVHSLEGCWKHSPSEWIKVNVDAAVSMVDSSAGISVVFCDCDGGWLLGSARFVGDENGLVSSIKRWINKDWQVLVRHVNRENNMVADKLPAKGRVLDFTTTTFDTVASDIEDLVAGERARSDPARKRSVNVVVFPYDPGGNT